jgi:hypothetical protein
MPRKIPEEVRQAVRDLYAQGGLTYDDVASQLKVTKNLVSETLQVTRTKTLADRFWAFVDKSAGPDGCWPWTGSYKDTGYGQLYVNEFKRPVVASRVSLYLETGEWPEEACHKCDNPPCVNPAHLFDGSRQDNMQDCASKGRVVVPALRGVNNPHGKLTEDDVFQIRTLYPFCRPSDLAKAFGVSRGHVVNIFNRRDRANG